MLLLCIMVVPVAITRRLGKLIPTSTVSHSTYIHSSGMPHIVLPLWVDLYSYATRVEYLGVGVWGNKATAPNWTAEELGNAFMTVLGDDEKAKSLRRKAKKLGDSFKDKAGRVCAADKLAELAVV